MCFQTCLQVFSETDVEMAAAIFALENVNVKECHVSGVPGRSSSTRRRVRPAFVALRRGSLRSPLRSERRLVRAARVELTTFGSGGRRSIQLSYARFAKIIMRSLPTAASILPAGGRSFSPAPCQAGSPTSSSALGAAHPPAPTALSMPAGPAQHPCLYAHALGRGACWLDVHPLQPGLRSWFGEHSRPGCGSACPRAEHGSPGTHQTMDEFHPPRVGREGADHGARGARSPVQLHGFG